VLDPSPLLKGRQNQSEGLGVDQFKIGGKNGRQFTR
jgi:hypothetical protein